MSAFSGVVSSAELCEPIEDVKITRFDCFGNMYESLFSDENGAYHLPSFNQRDVILFEKEGFVAKKYQSGTLPHVVRLLEDKLIAYQKKLWFLPNEEVAVFIHSPVKFTATLCRHGMYKERVLKTAPHPACKQKVPDGYFVASGLDWKKTLTYQIPLDAVPGLYSLLLEAEGQESFAIPFVVSTSPQNYGQKSKLLVLASTNTWQSYNLWGGRNRYRNFENDKKTVIDRSLSKRIKTSLKKKLPVILIKFIKRTWLNTPPKYAWMFQTLSIRRPFTNCSLEDETPFKPFTNHLAAGEWRLLAWLERENIPYDMVSGYDLHINGDLLKNYQAVIFSTHCEYWTSEMYKKVKQYHEGHQLWFLNLSGNTMYREIEFLENGSTRCVSLSFNESCADETKLLGVRFSEYDYATCAPYKIILPSHWVFEGTLINNKKTFGGLSLNQNTPKKSTGYDPGRPGAKNSLQGMGASGWETDKLSQTAPKDIKIVAKGLNPRGGADMVIREPAGSRGGMFSASSLCFSACLLIDQVASRIVKNVISRALSEG